MRNVQKRVFGECAYHTNVDTKQTRMSNACVLCLRICSNFDEGIPAQIALFYMQHKATRSSCNILP